MGYGHWAATMHATPNPAPHDCSHTTPGHCALVLHKEMGAWEAPGAPGPWLGGMGEGEACGSKNMVWVHEGPSKMEGGDWVSLGLLWWLCGAFVGLDQQPPGWGPGAGRGRPRRAVIVQHRSMASPSFLFHSSKGYVGQYPCNFGGHRHAGSGSAFALVPLRY